MASVTSTMALTGASMVRGWHSGSQIFSGRMPKMTSFPWYGRRSFIRQSGTGTRKLPMPRCISCPSRFTAAWKKFMAGLPMKPATKTLPGRS